MRREMTAEERFLCCPRCYKRNTWVIRIDIHPIRGMLSKYPGRKKSACEICGCTQLMTTTELVAYGKELGRLMNPVDPRGLYRGKDGTLRRILYVPSRWTSWPFTGHYTVHYKLVEQPGVKVGGTPTSHSDEAIMELSSFERWAEAKIPKYLEKEEMAKARKLFRERKIQGLLDTIKKAEDELNRLI